MGDISNSLWPAKKMHKNDFFQTWSLWQRKITCLKINFGLSKIQDGIRRSTYRHLHHCSKQVAAEYHWFLCVNDLKVPSGQIGSAWEWYYWIGLQKDINRYRFWLLIFDLEYLIRVQKFWAASCKIESNLLLVWITVCMCSNRDPFRRTLL